MDISSIISLFGGLAFFLFGMSLMGDSMKKIAGSKLETILGRLTSNRVKSILLGTFVTAIIQSSSATTVMVVGFVNSGLMKLGQAIGIIMGANIGTTATGWILTLAGAEGSTAASLLSTSTILAVAALIGILFYMSSKSTRKKNVGVLLLAFAVLMSGMKTMSAAMSPLQDSPAFLNAISVVSNPLLGILIGTIFTAIIQSNSAAVGILQALALTGIITFDTAVPLILGMNIGACAPVLLSAIGANKNGQRTAIIYLYYNLLGTLICIVGLYGAHALVGVPFFGRTVSSLEIAVINTVFKVVTTIILTPFMGVLEKLACLTFPSKPDDEEEFQENLLEERFLDYPPLAVEQSARTVEQMATASRKNLVKSIGLFDKFDQTTYDKIMSRENKVDRLEDQLGNYLLRLNTRELTDGQTRQTSKFLHALTDLERISDHAVNLADLAAEMKEKNIHFSEEAKSEMRVCMEAVTEIMTLAYKAVTEDDQQTALMVEPLEETIDLLSESLKARHIARLQTGQCTLELGFIFNDCVNNFERVADHCSNLALSVLELNESLTEVHDYVRVLHQGGGEEYRALMRNYEKKYTLPAAKEAE